MFSLDEEHFVGFLLLNSFLDLADVASSPAGVLVGSVTSQISTIHLTRPRGRPSTASSSPLSPCAPQTEESESGEAQLSG